jgi:hypothetical protein
MNPKRLSSVTLTGTVCTHHLRGLTDDLCTSLSRYLWGGARRTVLVCSGDGALELCIITLYSLVYVPAQAAAPCTVPY